MNSENSVKNKSSAPSLFQGKSLLYLICFYLFVIGFQRGCCQYVISDISEIFNTGTEGIGFLAGLQSIPPLFAPLLMGIIADRIGKKPIAIIFISLFSVGCMICGLSNGIISFIAGTLIFGIGSCVSENISTATITDITPEKNIQYINLSQFMFSMGAVAGPLILNAISPAINSDWHFPFLVCTIAFAVMAVLFCFSCFPAVAKKSKKDSVKDTSSIKTIITIVIVCLFFSEFLYIGMENGYGNYINSLMKYKYADNTAGALALSAFWGGMAASRLLFSMIKYSAGKVIRICFILSGVLMAFLVFSEHTAISVVLSAFIGFFYGPIWCIVQALAAKRSNGHTATITGALSLAGGIGGLCIPSLMGIVSGSMNIYFAILLLAAFSIIGGLFCMVIRE